MKKNLEALIIFGMLAMVSFGLNLKSYTSTNRFIKEQEQQISPEWAHCYAEQVSDSVRPIEYIAMYGAKKAADNYLRE